ncbi:MULTISPECIES: hypothetical protein [unclassified Streptomyces]|uniref:hypothetical protein n=1 Tax=unclassified Streptomyces TaxID=2593676 RepID=UPI0040439118
MWWHVCGVAAITAILVFVPQHHAGVSEVFNQRIDNTGFFGGHAFGTGFLFLVLPLSASFPQFTVTGYDASCHMSEETVGASDSAARGIWQAILCSGIGGWFLLLSEKFRAVLSLDKAWNALQWLLTASGCPVDTVWPPPSPTPSGTPCASHRTGQGCPSPSGRAGRDDHRPA